jgi:Zn-dependent protease
MRQIAGGSFPLFQVFGIQVYIHWSWFVAALIQYQIGRDMYGGVLWHVLTYLTLFAVVLLHEFSHALACKSVGGRADRIVLWPLGGIAFVQPPARPGPVLWSIAAGPLVNVVLVPVTLGLVAALGSSIHTGQLHQMNDVQAFVGWVAVMNLALLLFNLLPVYPLDGGQIVQALLWFVIGRAKSLMVVAIGGLAIGAAAAAFFLYKNEVWLALICGFVCWQSWIALTQARIMLAVERQMGGEASGWKM